MSERRAAYQTGSEPTPLHGDVPTDRAMLRPSDIQRLTGLSEGKVRELLNRSIRRNGIPAVRIDGCILVRVDDFRRWVKAQPITNA